VAHESGAAALGPVPERRADVAVRASICPPEHWPWVIAAFEASKKSTFTVAVPPGKRVGVGRFTLINGVSAAMHIETLDPLFAGNTPGGSFLNSRQSGTPELSAREPVTAPALLMPLLVCPPRRRSRTAGTGPTARKSRESCRLCREVSTDRAGIVDAFRVRAHRPRGS